MGSKNSSVSKVSFSSIDAAPTFLPKTKTYPPGSKLLPHPIRYNYAIGALEECKIQSKQGHSLSIDQQKLILDTLDKEKKKFIAFDSVGWISTILNFAVFVPVLVQAVQNPENQTNVALTWISFLNQLTWLTYAVGIRSYPILILSLLLIPLLITVLILLYQHQQVS